jgi:hypothetical protein
MFGNSWRRCSKGAFLQTSSRYFMDEGYNVYPDDYKNFKCFTTMNYTFNFHIATKRKFYLFKLTDCMCD